MKNQLSVGINEDVVATSLLNLHDNHIEESETQDIVINIEFVAIITSIKKILLSSTHG